PYGRADPVPHRLNAPFHERAHRERPSNAVSRYLGVPIRRDAVERDHVEGVHLIELIDQRLRQAVGEKTQRAVPALILEIQHRNMPGVEAARGSASWRGAPACG